MQRFVAFAAIMIIAAFAPRSSHCSEPLTLQELLQKEQRDEFDRRLSAPCEAVKYFVSFHSEPVLKWTFKNTDGQETEYSEHRILVVSWFRGDGRVALRYSVNEQGKAYDVRDVHNWALQASNSKTLTDEQLKSLQSLLSELPKSTATPTIDRTVYVSFKVGNDWRTETYDAQSLPKQFENVLLILGERFETRDRKERKQK